ncbi:MAG: universal stress protein [Chloroflexi bacterium]|nr:universal stress protein [Chloroflexota bacterium]
MYHRILVPLDGSLLAAQTLSHIGDLAAEGARVTLLQVVRRPMPVITPEVAAPMPLDDGAQIIEEARAYLRSQASGVIDGHFTVDIDVIEADDVAAAIVQYAREHDVDLIMMSTHGRGGLSRLVFGSVAEEVVRQAPCPVWVLRPH